MKTALITGSTRGIGRATGLALLQRGCAVAFHYRQDHQAAEQLYAELDREGYSGRFQLLCADLSAPEGYHELVSGLRPPFEALDYLIHNAAQTARGRLEDLTPDVWAAVLHTNLTAPLFLTQRCAHRMKQGGAILFLGAVMGQYPHALSIPYGVSKAGIHYLTRSLVKEFAEKHVRVNCVCPGFVETDWQKKKPENIRRSIESKIALHRFAAPEEVAELCCSVLENPYMNGSVVNIDGGYCYQ